jgi:hypothetical protein
MEDDLGVGGGREDGSGSFQFVAESLCSYQVSVVDDGEGLTSTSRKQGLGVVHRGAARSGVATVSDGMRAFEGVEHRGHKHVFDHAEPFAMSDRVPVRYRDPGSFLSSMLQGV